MLKKNPKQTNQNNNNRTTKQPKWGICKIVCPVWSFHYFSSFFLLSTFSRWWGQWDAGACYPCSLMNLALKELLETAVVVLLLCIVLFIVSLLPEVLLWMEGLFVNSFGVSQLGEICRGWGFNVLLLCQKYLDAFFKCSIVLGFLQLLYDFFFLNLILFYYPYFHYLLRFFLINHVIPI